MVKAWYMDDDTASDQRLPHQRTPNVEVSSAQLDALGVLQFKLNPFMCVTQHGRGAGDV
jgi:hypothetical protein